MVGLHSHSTSINTYFKMFVFCFIHFLLRLLQSNSVLVYNLPQVSLVDYRTNNNPLSWFICNLQFALRNPDIYKYQFQVTALTYTDSGLSVFDTDSINHRQDRILYSTLRCIVPDYALGKRLRSASYLKDISFHFKKRQILILD